MEGKYPMAAEDHIPRIRCSTHRERLLESKKHLEARLKNVDEALAALDAAPGVEKVLDLIQQAL